MATHHLNRDVQPSLSARTLYAAEMRFCREQAGLSLDELGRMLHLSKPHLSNLENGRRRIQLEFADRLDRVLTTNGFFVRNLEAGRSPHPEPRTELDYLEPHATEIRQWQPSVLPGPLQTPEYALAAHRGRAPLTGAPDEPGQHQETQARQAALLAASRTPMYWAILSEAVLHYPVGGPAAMADQLTHITALAHDNRILLQVLPFSAGPHPGDAGPLHLMTYPDMEPVASLTGMDACALISEPAAVKRYFRTFEILAAAALPPADSLKLLEATADDYAKGRSPATRWH